MSWCRGRRLCITAVALGLLVPACSGEPETGGGTDRQTTSSAPTATLPAPRDINAAGAKRLPNLAGADWLALAAGSAWLTGLGELLDEVGQLDGRTGKLLKTIKVPGRVCMSLDVGFGSVWAASCEPPVVTRIDPKTAAVQAKIAINAGSLQDESSIAAGEGGVWFLTGDSDPRLVKIDPSSNAVVKTVAAPAKATSIRAGFGGLWITSTGRGTLTRLDPGDLSVVAEINVGGGARFLTVGEGAVWVLATEQGNAVRVDPATNKAVATMATGSVIGGDIAAGGGSVWVRVADQLAARIDPATNTVVEHYGPAAGKGSVAVDRQAVWLSSVDEGTVWRLPLS